MTLSNYDLPSNVSVGEVINDVIIWVGQAPCDDVTLHNSTNNSVAVLQCTVTDQEAGYYPVDVLVKSSGYASVSHLTYGPLRNASLPVDAESAFPVVLMTSVVTSVSPPSGSTAGGTLLTITGTGFSTDIDKMKVGLGGADCKVTSSSRNTITCLSSSSQVVGVVSISITVNGYLVAADLSYTYSSDDTPIVDSV